MNTIKTTLHTYYFDLRVPEEKKQWLALRDKLCVTHPHCMESWGGGSHWFGREADGKEILLETKHLFNNQWNTQPVEGLSEKGLRVFDWALDASVGVGNSLTKKGHWLEQNEEMREVRRNTHKCRYCGKQEAAQKGYVFCPHCLDSEYLGENDLHLTRMKAIDDTTDCEPLTEAERSYLLPLYKKAQIHGITTRGKERIAKERADLLASYRKASMNAANEYDGKIWLLDHGISISNVIYYDHIERFSFGWQKPVDKSVESALLDVISEFSWPYEIKCADGRVLQGNIQ